MILKNTPSNRKLVNQLSDCIRGTTPYFRATVITSWNNGRDIRFEIASVGTGNPLIIATEYKGTFSFKVCLLTNQVEDIGELAGMACRLSDAEKLLLILRSIIESAHPALS